MLEVFVTYMKARIGDANERGASAVEYALLIALIAAAIIVAVSAVATQVNGGLGKIANKF